ncbi:hypothetical protein IJM86_01970 [bacterium]|nr:hypothetical protein [bacterium]
MYHIKTRARNNIALHNGKYQFYTETVSPSMEDFLNGKGIVNGEIIQKTRKEIQETLKTNTPIQK